MARPSEVYISPIEKLDQAASGVEQAFQYERSAYVKEPTSEILGATAQTLNNASNLVNNLHKTLQSRSYNSFQVDLAESNSKLTELLNQIPESDKRLEAVNKHFSQVESKLGSLDIDSHQNTHLQKTLTGLRDVHHNSIFALQQKEKQQEVTRLAKSTEETLGTVKAQSPATLISAVDSLTYPITSQIEDNPVLSNFQKEELIGVENSRAWQTVIEKNPVEAFDALKARDKDGKFIVKNIANRENLIEAARQIGAQKVIDDYTNQNLKRKNIDNKPWSLAEAHQTIRAYQAYKKSGLLTGKQENELVSQIHVDYAKHNRKIFYDGQVAMINGERARGTLTSTSQKLESIRNEYNKITGADISNEEVIDMLATADNKLQADPLGFVSQNSNIDLGGANISEKLEYQKNIGVQRPRIMNNQLRDIANSGIVEVIRTANNPNEINNAFTTNNPFVLDLSKKIINPANPESVSNQQAFKNWEKHKYQILEEAGLDTPIFKAAISDTISPTQSTDIRNNLYSIISDKQKKEWDQKKATKMANFSADKRGEINDTNNLTQKVMDKFGRSLVQSQGYKTIEDSVSVIQDYMVQTGKNVNDSMDDIFFGVSQINNTNMAVVYNPKDYPKYSSNDLKTVLQNEKSKAVDLVLNTKNYNPTNSSEYGLTKLNNIENLNKAVWVNSKNNKDEFFLVINTVSGNKEFVGSYILPKDNLVPLQEENINTPSEQEVLPNKPQDKSSREGVLSRTGVSAKKFAAELFEDQIDEVKGNIDTFNENISEAAAPVKVKLKEIKNEIDDFNEVLTTEISEAAVPVKIKLKEIKSEIGQINKLLMNEVSNIGDISAKKIEQLSSTLREKIAEYQEYDNSRRNKNKKSKNNAKK